MARFRCMLVEDQTLIAMALEASLEDAGFTVAGSFASGAQALDWLKVETPELAVLDVMLRDGTCLQLARELKRRRIPFAIYSGLRPEVDVPPELQGVPWLEKPIRREDLARTLERLARERLASDRDRAIPAAPTS
jgi:DNA-binding response OmpR family regulator